MTSEKIKNIQIIQDEATNWLIKSALPLWYNIGIDWNRGGFYESIDSDMLSCTTNFKRLRVLARQIYVFSVGYKLEQEYCKSAVIQGLDFLLTKARLSEGGFSSRLDLNGDVIEGDIDLYDLAFCLFSLAHGYRILKDSFLKEEAISLVTFISDRLAHASGGFIEGIPHTTPRRQNPHMHLFEALLEWRDLSDHIVFCDMLENLIDLFFRKFYFSNLGVLIEYFDENLIPLSDARGEVTEPGHHFEWVWLLSRYKAISSLELPSYTSLYNFARRNGINTREGLLWGEVSKFGEPVSSSVRLWPHTEWLKAELVTNAGDQQLRMISQSWCALSRFLDHQQRGLWYETFDHEKGTFRIEPSPASSLYHIVLAIEGLTNFVINHQY